MACIKTVDVGLGVFGSALIIKAAGQTSVDIDIVKGNRALLFKIEVQHSSFYLFEDGLFFVWLYFFDYFIFHNLNCGFPT